MSLSELTEAEMDQLEITVAVTNDRPGTWASNILCFHYNLCRPIPSGGEGEAPKSHHRGTTPAAIAVQALRLYPNPTSAWVAVDVDMPAARDRAQLRVLDTLGKVVVQRTLAQTEENVVLDTRELAPGLYLVELYNAGQRVGGEQLIVQP